MRKRRINLEHRENPAHQLIILGLLAEGPKHGYQIKKSIREISGRFTSIDTSSIYYPLRQLEKKGLLEKRISRSGRRPEKFVYHLTKVGRQRFENLLKDNLISMQRPFFNIDLCLYFLPFIKKTISLSYLEKRIQNLERIKRWLVKTIVCQESQKAPFHLLSILEHQLTLVKAEINYIKKLAKEI